MNFTNTHKQKKWLAMAGLVWFFYVVFHMLSLLNFHNGEQFFNNFYHQLNQFKLYYLMIIVLILAFIFHVYIAITRQIINGKSKGSHYKKPYPNEIPRFIAWSGAGTLFIFILTHFMQMKLLIDKPWYQAIVELLSNPLMLIFYIIGLLTLSAHLHHALSNVLQTLAITSKIYKNLIMLIIFTLFAGFCSILVRAAL